MSNVYNNATPHQAWRAGFREGVKMSLVNGVKPSVEEFKKIHWKNLERLYIWCMTGADVKNGDWAILGARAGLYKTMCTDWDYVNVRDFEYLNNLWSEEFSNFKNYEVYDESCKYTNLLVSELDIPIDDPLAPGQSKFVKSIYKNPSRQPHIYLQGNDATKKSDIYDIIMITYNEPNADENFAMLQSRFPRARRIHGIKGIHQAHIAAANIATTDMVWIVDGDAVIKENFNFDYIVEKQDLDAVHVWRSENPINDLVYGYGGVKLLPTYLTRHMDTSKPDMTTSISHKFKKMDQISNVTAFNADEFSTWRSAFRECAKLSSKVIDRQKTGETDERLKTWTTVGHDRQYGEYAIRGARAGMEYGLSDGVDLKLINDFDWLKEKYNEQF